MNVESIKTVLVTAPLFCSVLFSFLSSPAQANDKFAQARAQTMQSPKAPLLPRNLFISQPALKTVSLSPNGQSLAYKINQGRHTELWRYDIQSQSHERKLSVKQIREMHWSADSRYLYYTDNNALYLADLKANNLARRVYDLSDSNTAFLRPDPDLADVFWLSQYQAKTQQHALLRLDINGEKQTAYVANNPLNGFLTHAGKLLLVEQWSSDTIHILNPDDPSGATLMQCRPLAPCRALHWDQKSQTLLVLAYGDEDILSVFSVDVQTGKKQLIHQDPSGRFDVNKIALTATGQPHLVSYRTDFTNHYGLTSNTRHALRAINAKTLSPLTWLTVSDDQKTWLVIDANPHRAITRFQIYQSSTQTWQSPFEHIDTSRMPAEYVAPRLPFWYTASDGMQLQGYVTLPLGVDPENTPLVVNPHGGPWNRVNGSFNRYTQFLANRGYIVFEPNFRSSTGMGYQYVTRANKDFGNGRVQQDIIDGLDHLLAAGIGDPKQQAIAGHSFGGFSALTALAFTPERFKVAFAGAAPSNLSNSMLRYARRAHAQHSHPTLMRIKKLMVDIKDSDDVNRLYNQSPDKHWRNISKPLFMWAGERDDRVAIEDVRDIALRLEQAGQPVALLADPKEGHSPESDISRDAYYYLLETALAQYLNGRAETHKSPTLKRYLQKYMVMDTAGSGVE